MSQERPSRGDDDDTVEMDVECTEGVNDPEVGVSKDPDSRGSEKPETPGGGGIPGGRQVEWRGHGKGEVLTRSVKDLTDHFFGSVLVQGKVSGWG